MTPLLDRPRPPLVQRRARASTRVAVTLGRAAGALSRGTGRGRGSTLPGRVGLRLAPALLGRLARGRPVLLVSGTNGKSTTTRLLTAALATQRCVLSNGDGSNMRGGLATTLMRPAPSGAPVVLEIDEHVLSTSAAELAPQVIVLLNLTRDQLDRTGEVSALVHGWTRALREVPEAVLVVNADDPLVCAAVLGARPDGAGVRWVAAGQPWRRDCPLCPLCGDAWSMSARLWECGRCGFARPAPDRHLEGAELVTPGAPRVRLQLALPGRANLANAALAVTAAAELGVPADVAAAALRSVVDVDGRYWSTDHAGGRVRLLLSKNPAGWAEVLGELAGSEDGVVVAVNNHDADGADTSWLWDVPFEQLQGRCVVASGECAADVSLRLLYADVEHRREPDALRALDLLRCSSAQVVANYTAFTRVRDQLRAA